MPTTKPKLPAKDVDTIKTTRSTFNAIAPPRMPKMTILKYNQKPGMEVGAGNLLRTAALSMMAPEADQKDKKIKDKKIKEGVVSEIQKGEKSNEKKKKKKKI